MADEKRNSHRFELVEPFGAGIESVYFMRARGMPLVKIGWSNCVIARIEQMQTGCPFLLDVVAQIPGPMNLEKTLHKQFSACHFRGEWFYLTDHLAKFIHAQAEVMRKQPRPLNIAEQIRAERDPEYIELRERARELFESRRRKRVYSE